MHALSMPFLLLFLLKTPVLAAALDILVFYTVPFFYEIPCSFPSNTLFIFPLLFFLRNLFMQVSNVFHITYFASHVHSNLPPSDVM